MLTGFLATRAGRPRAGGCLWLMLDATSCDVAGYLSLAGATEPEDPGCAAEAIHD